MTDKPVRLTPKRSADLQARGPVERPPTVDLVGVQAVFLRRTPVRLGGVCSVVLLIQGQEVELMRHAGDLVDMTAWPLGIRQRLDQAGVK